MAFVPLVPVAMNITPTKGLKQNFQSVNVKDPSGTNIDLSAWNSIVAIAAPSVPGVNTSDVSFGTCSGDSAGVITLDIADTDFGSSSPGQAILVVKGKQSSGDAYQILARGSLTLQSS